MKTYISPITELMISVPKAAQLLGISRRTFYRMIDRGQIPQPVSVGRRSLVPVADLREFVEGLRRSRA